MMRRLYRIREDGWWGEGRRPSSWVLGFAGKQAVGQMCESKCCGGGGREREGAREEEEERHESIIQGL